jgi:uncharacterized membrane protein
MLSGAHCTAYNYTNVATAYKHLLQSTVLRDHIASVAALVRGCTRHLSAQVTAVRTYLAETVLAQEDTISHECCKSYNFWYDSLSAFRAAFAKHRELAKEVNDTTVTVQRRLKAVLTNIVNQGENEVESALARRLVAIKALAERLPSVKHEIEAQLVQLLNTIKNRDAQSIVGLAVLLGSVADPTDHSVRDHAQMLLKNYRIFDGYQLSLFNTKVTRYAFDQVLERTRAQQLRRPDEGGPNRRAEAVEGTISVEGVLRQYRKFNDKYRTLVRRGLTQIVKAKERCKVAVQEISRRSCIPFTVKVRELMVQLFLYWTLSNSTHYFDNVGGQAAESAADDSSRKYLKQPHAGQIISIFRMFGIDCGVASEQELQNHFVQIGTGEGKSVVLAITSCIFALLGKVVHCVCYSEYLYMRDQADFKPLFEAFNVESSIKYGTFQDLCESYLNRRGDIRDSVQSIVECPTGQGTRGGAKPSNFPADGVPKVLLIDEVDVFFKGDFYGCAYRPTAALRDETVSDLLDYVWSCRDGFVPVPGVGGTWGTRRTTLAKLKGSPLCGDCGDQVATEPPCISCLARYRGSPQYHACVARFPDWVHVIDEAIKQMLRALKTFRNPHYHPEVHGDNIVYRIQDRLDSTYVDGYNTLFAYYQAAHEGKISAAALVEQKCIRIDCGAYSYAEIPKIYDHLVGVSGTLESLQDAERDILHSAYKVQRLTYAASVYSDATASKLKFRDDAEDVRIVLASGYSAAIAEQIRVRRVVPSNSALFLPVLVFFKTSAQVEAFKTYLVEPVNRVAAATIQTITEKNTTGKEDFIRQAVRAGTVTLLSRELGRGTDFYVYSDSIDAAGGVVVIQTFLSEDVSEEVQIKSRTARQDNNGSYCLVLSEKDLLTDFSINTDSVAAMNTGGSFMMTLSQARAIRYHHHYEQLEGDIAVLEKEYNGAMQFIDTLAVVPNGPLEDAPLSKDTVAAVLAFLKDRNTCPPAPIRLSRTLVLMDATDSMSSLLKGAKDGVHSMFTGAQATLQEAGVKNRTFEMQFAVYRNYNTGKGELFQCSKWTSDVNDLTTFMESVDVAGGAGREAIEIGMWHANREIADRGEGERYQVLLIGDMPPNLPDAVRDHRSKMCTKMLDDGYWNDTPYAQPVYFEDEFKQLVLEEVPVHAFYIGNQTPTKRAFVDIALRSNGVSAPLDIKSAEGAETLKRLITERVLDDVVGGGPEGRRLRETYGRLQQGLQATG